MEGERAMVTDAEAKARANKAMGHISGCTCDGCVLQTVVEVIKSRPPGPFSGHK